nr:MAG TPA: hypothetical protein [Caudoviricetes sp.]
MSICSSLLHRYHFVIRLKIQPAGYHKDKPAGCITFPRQKVHPSFVAFP